jgi:Ca2+-binding EF-hand superfamily protein
VRYPPSLALALCFFLGVASARTLVPKLDEEGRKGDVARMIKEKTAAQFDAADGNKDGKLSREEVARQFPHMSENFDRRDIDKDGFLGWEEFVGHDRWKR